MTGNKSLTTQRLKWALPLAAVGIGVVIFFFSSESSPTEDSADDRNAKTTARLAEEIPRRPAPDRNSEKAPESRTRTSGNATFDVGSFEQTYTQLARQFTGDELTRQQMAAIRTAGAQLTSDDVIAFLEIVRNDSGDSVWMFALTNYASSLIGNGPGRAMEQLQTLPDDAFSKGIAKEVGQAMSSSFGLERVQTLLNDHPDFLLTEELMAGFCFNYFSTHPISSSEVSALIQLTEDGKIRNSDFASALSHLNQKSDFPSILTALEARNFGSSEANKSGIVAACFDSWASSDPKSASLYLATIDSTSPDLKERTTVLAERWYNTAPKAASDWAAELKQQPQRDYAAQIISQRTLSKSPEDAMSWANSITDGEIRLASIRTVMETSPPEAQPALLKSLSAEDQAALSPE